MTTCRMGFPRHPGSIAMRQPFRVDRGKLEIACWLVTGDRSAISTDTTEHWCPSPVSQGHVMNSGRSRMIVLHGYHRQGMRGGQRSEQKAIFRMMIFR